MDSLRSWFETFNCQSFLAGLVKFGQELEWILDPYGPFALCTELIAFSFICVYDLAMATLLLVRVLRVKSIRETIQTLQYRSLVFKLGVLYLLWISIIITTLMCIFETAFNDELSFNELSVITDAGYLGLTFELFVAFEFMQVIELPVKIRAQPENYVKKRSKKASVVNEAPVFAQEPVSGLQCVIEGIQAPNYGSNEPMKDPERFLRNVSTEKPKSTNDTSSQTSSLENRGANPPKMKEEVKVLFLTKNFEKLLR